MLEEVALAYEHGGQLLHAASVSDNYVSGVLLVHLTTGDLERVRQVIQHAQKLRTRWGKPEPHKGVMFQLALNEGRWDHAQELADSI